MNMQALLNRIDANKALIDARRPLAPEEVRELDAYFRIGSTYASNALEGSTLTLSETKVLIEDGLTVAGKPIRECYEAIGHAHAYDYMLGVARGEDFVITETVILHLHKLFYQQIDPEKAGVYRDHQVFISGTEYVPPKAEEVPSLMQGLVAALHEKWDTLHPIRLAAFAHRKLVDIHPFVDGNGRTARLLMNLILIGRGYQIVSIPPMRRLEYINALKAAQRDDRPSDAPFIALIAECVMEAQRDYCRMFHIEFPKREN